MNMNACININTCGKDDLLGFLYLSFSRVGGLGDSLVAELLVTGCTLVEELAGVSALDSGIEVLAYIMIPHQYDNDSIIILKMDAS